MKPRTDATRAALRAALAYLEPHESWKSESLRLIALDAVRNALAPERTSALNDVRVAPSKCPTCNDTGSWKDDVGYEYCCCAAGTKRRGAPGVHKWVDASLGQVCARCAVHSSESIVSPTGA